MANQIPLSTASNAAGGYLLTPETQDALLSTIARESAVFQLAKSIRVSTKQTTWPVYLGRPTAAFVGEAATKPTTGAEFGQLTANVKKIATNVIYTTEFLEDAIQNPQMLVEPDTEAAIADLADYHAVGTHVGGSDTTATYTSSFDAALANTTQETEYVQANADAWATALSDAIAKLEANGYTRNLSVLAGYRLKQALRDARDANTVPLYQQFNSNNVVELYGVNHAFSTNVNKTDAGAYDPLASAGRIGGSGSPKKVLAIVGDFARAMGVIRNDLTTQVFREATINGVNLAETNQIAVQYEVRMGFQVYDLNRAFVKIVNAS